MNENNHPLPIDWDRVMVYFKQVVVHNLEEACSTPNKYLLSGSGALGHTPLPPDICPGCGVDLNGVSFPTRREQLEVLRREDHYEY